MSRLAITASGFLLAALSVSASDAERSPGGSGGPLSPSSLLTAGERYAEQEVLIRGVVAATKRDVFPNGRAYYTLSISDGPRVVTVFSCSNDEHLM